MVSFDIAVLNTLAKLIEEQAKWADETFGTPDTTGPIPPLKHMKKEVDETIKAINEFVERGIPGHAESKAAIELEFADIFLLLLDASRRQGIPFHRLVKTAYEKQKICEQRVWNIPKWEYRYEERQNVDGFYTRCYATNGVVELYGDEETYLKAKIEVQKKIKALDREPHEHNRSNE